MNSRRTIILLVAVLIAGLSFFGILNYVRGLEDSAYEGQELVEVWVVKEPIPRGTPAQQVIATQLIAKDEVPIEYKPATAIVDPSTELLGLVAVTDLPANSVLVQGNFVAPGVVATGVTDRLEERGMVTVTFSLDQVGAAAYLIEPGDFVNILTRISLKPAETEDDTVSATDDEYDRSEERLYLSDVRYVYQKVEVLAIDKSLTADLGQSTAAEDDPAAAAAAAANRGLITLAVPPEAVQRILAVGIENLYLSLVPPTYQPVELPPIEINEDLLPGEDVERLTPYGPPEANGSAEADQ